MAKLNLNLDKIENSEFENYKITRLLDTSLNLSHFFLNKPIVVEKSKFLEIKIPTDLPADFLLKHLNNQIKIENKTERIKLDEFVKLFNKEESEDATINGCIYFNLNKTELNCEFEPPKIIKELSDAIGNKTELLSKNLLIMTAETFMDFAISSIEWYHLISGTIIVYLIEPTEKNLGNIYWA